MQSPASSRKRRVAGASQPIPQPLQQINDLSLQPNQDSDVQYSGQYMDWNNADGIPIPNAQFADQTALENQGYGVGYTPSFGLDTTVPLDPVNLGSNQLVRRIPNQQMARTWIDAPDMAMQQTQSTWDDEDEKQLEQRALIAKRDATAKRKQIPPFVQKLSRQVFLAYLKSSLTPPAAF